MSWAAQGRHRGGWAAGSPEPGHRGAGASQILTSSPGPFFLGPFFSQILLSPSPFLPASLSGPEPRSSPSGIPSHSGKARSSRFTGGGKGGAKGKAAPAPEDSVLTLPFALWGLVIVEGLLLGLGHTSWEPWSHGH